MAFDLIPYIVQYLTYNNLAATGIVLVVGFVLWELPRFLQIDEDLMKSLYPSYGKMVDVAVLVLGLVCLAFLLLNLRLLAPLSQSHGFGLLLGGGLVGLPVVLLLAFFARIFNRMDNKLEPHVYVLHVALDLLHTLFYIAFAGLAVPSAALFFSFIL